MGVAGTIQRGFLEERTFKLALERKGFQWWRGDSKQMAWLLWNARWEGRGKWVWFGPMQFQVYFGCNVL